MECFAGFHLPYELSQPSVLHLRGAGQSRRAVPLDARKLIREIDGSLCWSGVLIKNPSGPPFFRILPEFIRKHARYCTPQRPRRIDSGSVGADRSNVLGHFRGHRKETGEIPGVSNEILWGKRACRKKRKSLHRQAKCRTSVGRSIDERPQEVADRQQVGTGRSIWW